MKIPFININKYKLNINLFKYLFIHKIQDLKESIFQKVKINLFYFQFFLKTFYNSFYQYN